MPNPGKPVELMELAGSYKINPSRRRSVGAKSEYDLGEPPITLGDYEIECWMEIQHKAVPGVLTRADSMIVEIAAILMAKLRRDGLTAAEITQYIKALSLLGMTPLDRSKIVAEKQEDVSPYSEFAS